MERTGYTVEVGSDAALERARHFLDIGRHDLAEREMRAALTHDPHNPALHVQLGWALEGRRRRGDAEQEARTALAGTPDDTDARVLLSHLCMEQGRHREAESMLLEALHHEPENSHLYLVYGILMLKTGHVEKAERLVRKSLELFPENHHAHSTLAIILAERERGGLAKTHGRHAVSLDPAGERSHALLGMTYLRTGHPFKARMHLREALRLESGDPDVEVSFLEADRATRWIFLPMYFWSLLISRLPGQQFAVWGVFIALNMIMPNLGVPAAFATGFNLCYLAFALYTWVAEPLANLWIRFRPPRY